jgi:flavin reductase (DIM6/NTAB) family NADH-FMN oxidoreductase RutF
MIQVLVKVVTQGEIVLERDYIQKVLRLWPSPLVIVTASYMKKRAAMTAAWATQLSWDPPYVAVAMHYEGYTLKVIRKSREFAIHLVSEDLSKMAVKVFGSFSSKDVDKFKKANVTVVPSRKVKAPIIKEAIAIYECKVVKTLKVGDHYLIIGEPLIAYSLSTKKPVLWRRGVHKIGDLIK